MSRSVRIADNGSPQQLLEMIGWDSSSIELFQSLRIPSLQWAAVESMELWEHELSVACEAFLLAGRIQCKEFKKRSAAEIGLIVTRRLLKGCRSVLTMTEDGLNNLRDSQPFKASAKRRNLPERVQVLVAFFFLKRGISHPPQRDVVHLLEKAGTPLAAGRIARLFDELSLRDLQGDGRMHDPSSTGRKPIKDLLAAVEQIPAINQEAWQKYKPLVGKLIDGGFRRVLSALWLSGMVDNQTTS